MTVKAFNAIAGDYDRTFTDTAVGRILRQAVWRHLAVVFRPGTRIWELNCGTGEDAVWLAGQDIRVLATDGSPAMLRAAADKAAAHGRTGRIEFRCFDFSEASTAPSEEGFDGALSNFGGLNCVPDLTPLARLLGRCVKPGGHAILVVMGRWCLWEMLWHLIHLKPGLAFRRIARNGAAAGIGGRSAHVWYPSGRKLCAVMKPEFRLARVMGLGVVLPPTYLQPAVVTRKRLFRLLCRLEGILNSAAVIRRFGDHILYDFERTMLTPRDRS